MFYFQSEFWAQTLINAERYFSQDIYNDTALMSMYIMLIYEKFHF